MQYYMPLKVAEISYSFTTSWARVHGDQWRVSRFEVFHWTFLRFEAHLAIFNWTNNYFWLFLALFCLRTIHCMFFCLPFECDVILKKVHFSSSWTFYNEIQNVDIQVSELWFLAGDKTYIMKCIKLNELEMHITKLKVWNILSFYMSGRAVEVIGPPQSKLR